MKNVDTVTAVLIMVVGLVTNANGKQPAPANTTAAIDALKSEIGDLTKQIEELKDVRAVDQQTFSNSLRRQEDASNKLIQETVSGSRGAEKENDRKIALHHVAVYIAAISAHLGGVVVVFLALAVQELRGINTHTGSTGAQYRILRDKSRLDMLQTVAGISMAAFRIKSATATRRSNILRVRTSCPAQRGEKQELLKIKAIHIAIPVLDMPVAVSFYTHVFGLKVRSQSDDLCQLSFDTHRFSLRRTRASSASLQQNAESGIRSRHFGFEVPGREDVGKAAEEVMRHGGKIVVGPMEREDGSALFCVDPSGNQIEIYWLAEGC